MPLGNVGKRYFMQEEYILLEDFPASTKEPTVDEARDIAAFASSLFLGGQIDEFRVVYTRMYSAVRQEPQMISLLPFPHERLEPGQRSRAVEGLLYEYLPDEAALFDYLAPKYLKGMEPSSFSSS